uniref:Ig-like domain-containing protein n=1 Tax=Denticeps clupeoides TaxID=299321 RepID=A0AAY4AGM4_9TELE
MIPALIILSLLCVAGIQGKTDVIQTPSIIWKNMGESAEMTCHHMFDDSYFQMYWYRQHRGESMRLIVFTTTSSKDFGDFKEDKYSTVKTVAQNGSFTVKSLDADDSGTYFCSVSKHSVTDLHCRFLILSEGSLMLPPDS